MYDRDDFLYVGMDSDKYDYIITNSMRAIILTFKINYVVTLICMNYWVVTLMIMITIVIECYIHQRDDKH